jgi:BirA family biotin operon repressor/biotin-[acetyl-CoA-carboxylase] ligase
MLGRPLIRLDAVASTMIVLGELATAGAREGTTVVAGHQSAGRGRANRRWITPPDTALLASVLLRPGLPHHRLSALSILVGDAIAASVHALYGLEARIKWPNDVLINGRKVSGVLIQSRMQPPGMVVIVGFGINANIAPPDIPPAGTSLLAELGSPVDRDALLRRTLDELDTRYQDLLAGRLQHRWLEIGERIAMRGELVSVEEGGEIITGTLKRVDIDGALVLDFDGQEQRIVVGDLSRGPKPVVHAGK